MNTGRQSRTQCEAEKQPGPQPDDSSENPQKNCANGEFIYRGLHGNDQGELGGAGPLSKSIPFRVSRISTTRSE